MRSCCILLRPAARRASGTLTVTLDEWFQRASLASPALKRKQKMVDRTELAVNLARKNYYMGRMPAYFRCKQRNGVAE